MSMYVFVCACVAEYILKPDDKLWEWVLTSQVLRIELRSLGLVVKSLYGELSCWSSNCKGW